MAEILFFTYSFVVVPPSPAPGTAVSTMGDLGTADQVGRAQVIVNARLTHWESSLAHHAVDHVIRHPLAAQGVKYVSMGSATPLNGRREDLIIATIADGSAFEPRPQPGDILAERMTDAHLIVRAQLVQVAAGESKWRITGILKGDAGSPTLVLDDEFFRLRAQAIVAHAARKQSPPPTSPPETSRVDAETERLIRAELTVPKDAILFVDQVRATPDSVLGRLRHRAYEDVGKQKLDELQDAISRPDGESRL
jgi:hypothetical protein